MKKLIIATTYLLLFMVGVHAQQTGVQFVQAGNWQQVLDKAKKENKYIFVDCYATWCGPCKMMDKNIFPDREVGQYFNDKFVAVKIQFDKTKEDAAFVKNWHKDARMLEEKYSVMAYPTYLIFSPAGEPLHRFTGASQTPVDFITKTKKALDPATQYYTTVYQYKKQPRDSAVLRNGIKAALAMSDRKMAAEIGNYYFDVVNPFTKENLMVLRQVTLSSKNKGYGILMQNQAKADSISGPGFTAVIVKGVMYEDDLKPYIEGAQTTDWNKLAEKVKKKYPLLKPLDVDRYGTVYYRMKNDIPAYEKEMLAFVKKYENELNDVAFNDCAWGLFELSDNREVLKTALTWSEKSLEMVPKTPGSNYCNFMDTYANLHYKLGNKEEAIRWEKKAFALASETDKSKIATGMEKTLAKMEKGEKTW